ncbi:MULTISPECIES: DEAD/DEAH box helicase [Paenibacillus]|uniref:ATP-dependent RNA helicase CshA n=1 Tax=Paenibacillus odorifer TaxID=189426 RepID=A0AAD0KKR3_9BACL|nr:MULTISPECIES: DEAD/DEAH box helicase [Paenibacillus]AWV34324.1 ATP-dependent helicase [Paenibacillus odorifer]ETT45869.1 DEAD/DEAH box helicase domain-containing protein [Paenibacillus sp. FSL H8-237]MEC0133267.1 DEAD/DEAH box helicase [Paenibacillus odorifer]MEC0223300.1 DEAD/DEAH box helicase [Paenibacillus odorifer]OZQ65382.1 DEAD/DEAH box helicase [Paenibacillus odorifer]
MTFNELNIVPAILKALSKENYTSPTPIQEQSIPAVLAGRDLLGCAQTGTGKTAAFSVPIIQLLSEQSNPNKSNNVRRIRSLILTPTRELAIQIADNIKAYSQYTDIRSAAIVGGVSQKVQERALNQGADILIATPGRLIDLINQKRVDLQYVQILVLDEADRMLDMGFIHDVKRIIAKMPTKKQTLFFSATMPTEISKLIKTLLVNPVKVEITPVSSTADRINQSIYLLENGNKQNQLNLLLQDKSIVSALVFTRTKRGADRVTRDLAKVNISAQAIHGNKSQNDRQNALRNFKSGATRVLVATDIAARGIDIDELSHVINFNLPNIPETYVHRIGRTGRAGLSGTAISFCEAEELPFLKDIEKLIGKSIPEVKDHPYPMSRKTQMKTDRSAKPSGSKAAASRPSSSRPSNSKPATAKPAATKPAATKSAASKPAKAKPKSNPPLKPKSEWFTKGRQKTSSR